MTDWNATLLAFSTEFEGFEVFEPTPDAALEQARLDVRWLPDDLTALYRVSNGVSYGWFHLLAVYVRSDFKRTWDSISRANDGVSSAWADWPELHERFLVFAKLSGLGFAAFSREDSAIWYFENDELHCTDLDLPDFIRTVSREVHDL